MFDTYFFTNFLTLSKPLTLVALALLGAMFYVVSIFEKKKIDFAIRMLIGLALGVALGLVLQAMAGFPSPDELAKTVWIKETATWYGLFGGAFVSFVRMLVIPIIFFSLVKVVLGFQTGVNISAIAGRAIFWLLFTTAIAILIGLGLSLMVNLGANMQVVGSDSNSIREVSNVVSTLVALIPSNPVAAFAKENIVGLVIFSVLAASSARIMKGKAKYKTSIEAFEVWINAWHAIIMSIAMTIIKYMPYAVIALMSGTILENGFDAIKQAGTFIILIYVSMFLMFVVQAIILMMHGLNPIVYFKKVTPALLMAFSSRSSVGSLPMTISTLEGRVGVNDGTANLVSSLGSTIGMNGCAGYFPAMVAIFIANVTNTPIDASFIAMVLMVGVLGSLGIAGIPGTATIAASVMLTGMGMSNYFPLLAIILAVDPLIDMARTLSNVAGAMCAATVTDKEMGTLDLNAYNDPNYDLEKKVGE